MEIPVEKRVRRKRKLPGEKEDDVCQTLVQEVKGNIYKCHDRLVNELEAWFDSITHLQTVFAGLSLQAILEYSEGELERKYKILGSEYSADLNVSRLPLEVLRLRDFLAAVSKVERDMTMMNKSSAIEWLWWSYRRQVRETMLNIVIALRLFLTLTVSVATVERNISKLKLIKSYLRSNMLRNRLSSLSLVLIEHETVEKIDFDQVISKFASAKARKVKIF